LARTVVAALYQVSCCGFAEFLIAEQDIRDSVQAS